MFTEYIDGIGEEMDGQEGYRGMEVD